MRKLFFSFKLFLFFCFLIIIGIIALYIYAYITPKIDLRNTGNLYIYDNTETLVYQGSKNSEWVELENISSDLINAVISVEDKNFYSHNGFDYVRIASALLNNIQTNSLSEGASTITQQYARNMYLDFNKTWDRKIEEAFLSLELEVHYDKNEILEGYLNTIYYGHGNYGIQNASTFYFNKDASELTFEEALMLAGVPNSPNSLNPLTNYDACVKRAKIVAETMVNNEYISWDEYDSLFQENVFIYGKHTENNLQMLMYYQDAVLDELDTLEEIPDSLVESGGLKIYTNLDMEAQISLEENILEYKVDDEHQVASILVDPESGAVIALTGGMDYSTSTYNRALYSERQVGSTMKSFLYYAALENNMTMASTFTSEHTVFNLSNNQIYSPGNFNGLYAEKDITMAAATAFSDNIYAVKTNLFLGVDTLIETAQTVGIEGDLDNVASLALGTSELNIMDLATGYTTFASGGYKRDLHLISRIEDMNGNILYEKKIVNELVINPNYTYILNEMLTSTTNEKFSDYTTATALSIADVLTHKYAFKSGTTNTDNWNVGYNSELLMAIWMGYDEGRDTTSEISRAERNIWASTMEEVLLDTEDTWYDQPKNVIGLMLDAVTGLPTTDESKATIYYFIKGTEPGASSFVMDP